MDYDDPTPAGVSREIWRWFPAWVNAVIALMLLGGMVVLVGWQAAGWFESHGSSRADAIASAHAQRQAHIVQANFNVQQGYVTQVTDDVQAIDSNVVAMGSDPAEATSLTPEDIHAGADACHYASLLVPGDVTLAQGMPQWIKANCQAGALNPASNIYKGGNGL